MSAVGEVGAVTEVSEAVRLGGLPRVNLLPPEIAERQRFRRVQGGLGATVLAAAAIVLAGYAAAAAAVGDAEDELAAARTEQSRLRAEEAQYARVPEVYAQVAAREAQRTQAMAREVRWSYYLDEISKTLPDRVWLNTLTANLAGEQGSAAAAPGAAPSPAAGAGTAAVGQVQFRGRAFSHDDVAAWLDSVNAQKGNAGAYLSSSSRKKGSGGRTVVDFAGSVSLTPETLSRRFTAGGR